MSECAQASFGELFFWFTALQTNILAANRYRITRRYINSMTGLQSFTGNQNRVVAIVWIWFPIVVSTCLSCGQFAKQTALRN